MGQRALQGLLGGAFGVMRPHARSPRRQRDHELSIRATGVRTFNGDRYLHSAHRSTTIVAECLGWRKATLTAGAGVPHAVSCEARPDRFAWSFQV